MVYIVHFCRIIFIESAKQTTILSKSNSAFRACLCRHLFFLALKAFYRLYFLELHALHLASLLVDELLVVAELARIVQFAAGSLHVT